MKKEFALKNYVHQLREYINLCEDKIDFLAKVENFEFQKEDDALFSEAMKQVDILEERICRGVREAILK